MKGPLTAIELSNMLGTQKSGPIAGADNSKEAIGGTQDRTLQELRSLNQQQSKGREQPEKRIKNMCGLFAWNEEIAFARPKPGGIARSSLTRCECRI